MEIIKQLPWWAWGLILGLVLIAVAVATGAAQAAGGALLALVGSGMAAHKANARARKIGHELEDRLEAERSAVDALNQEQETELGSPTSPITNPPTDSKDEAERRDAVRDPWK